MITERDSLDNFIKALEKTFDEIKSSGLNQKGPEYQGYESYLNRITRGSLIKMVHYLKRITKPVDSTNLKKVLEVGSGFGLNLVILNYLGFEKVIGIEIVEQLNENANLLINTAKKYCDFEMDNCKSVLGDAANTFFRDEEFDLIFCIEVISHVPSFDRFLREMNRLLNKNSFIIIADSNNCSCPWYYKKRKLLWKKNREHELKSRLAFLEQNFPDINPNFRASIALHTELMSKKDLCTVIPLIISTNNLPMSLYFEGNAPVYFETGIWNEFGFFPKKLIRDIRKYGFQSWINIAFGSSKGYIFEIIEDALNLLPLSIKGKLRGNFICYSKKEKEIEYLL